MGPRKASASPLVKKVRNTIEFKKEIIEKYESGVRVTELARMYGKPHSTITSIVAKGKEIKCAVVAKGVDMLTKKRSQTLEEVERLLLVWITQKQLAGDSIMQSIICEKARQLHNDLVKKVPATSGDACDFKASKGWFERFKKRSGIHSVVRHHEAASSDKKAAEKFEELTTAELQELHLQQQEITAQEIAAEEEEERWRKVPSSKIKDICAKWTEVQLFMDELHPDKAVAGRIGNMYNDSVVSHFRQILKKRQKRSFLDRYFVRQGSSDSQVDPSGIKKRRREVTPEKDLAPEALMKGDFPSKQ
nr:tigger transposable element-derived protein 1-like [Cherax quadricarinatus]